MWVSLSLVLGILFTFDVLCWCSSSEREREDKEGGQALSNKDNEWELYG